MNILLVEDEPLAQQRISSILAKNFPGREILDTAQRIKEFKNAWSAYPNIDLVLYDIHLADGLSFKAFEGIKVEILVIFITAYDQYALQLFNHNCIDYVLKPIDENRLVRA
jgi:two-component system response regulator LytT